MFLKVLMLIRQLHLKKIKKSSTKYQQNKEKLKEYAQNYYHSLNSNVMAKEYCKNNKENLSEQARN